MFQSTPSPNKFTLHARDRIPISGVDGEDHDNTENQIYRVSLLNNPATSIPKREIQRLFKIRDEYNIQLQEAEAKHEIDAFECRATGKPIPPVANVPFPSELNIDVIRANEPSSAIRMYSTAQSIKKNNINKSSMNNTRSKSVTAIKRNMTRRCPCCNPEPLTNFNVPVKPRNGPTHWQVQDEPLLPSLPPNIYIETHKSHPFYSTPKRSINLTIPIIVGDFVNQTESSNLKFEKEMKNKIEREKKARSKLLQSRALANREKMRKRQQDLSDLESRSGQLKAQSRLSLRTSQLAKSRQIANYTPPISKEDQEALDDLKKFDDNLWNQTKLQKNHGPISLLLIQEVETLDQPGLNDEKM